MLARTYDTYSGVHTRVCARVCSRGPRSGLPAVTSSRQIDTHLFGYKIIRMRKITFVRFDACILELVFES